MLRVLLTFLLLAVTPAALAADRDAEPLSAVAASFKANVTSTFGVSFPALIELVQRYGDGFDFVDSAEKSREWPYLQELVRAGYMEISVQDGMGGYMMHRKVYMLRPTAKGVALREALVPPLGSGAAQ